MPTPAAGSAGSSTSMAPGERLQYNHDVQKLFADVVLRLAVPGTLQFSVPENLRDAAVPGKRVRVPLRNGYDIGYLASLSDSPKVEKVRPIAAILDREPLLPADLLELLMAVARHTLAPPGLVFRSALPRAIHFERTAKATAREKAQLLYHLQADAAEVPGLIRTLSRRAPLQASLLARAAEGPLSAAGLSSSSGPALKALVSKGFLREERKAVRRGLVHPPEHLLPLPPLTADQEKVFQEIRPSLALRQPSVFLLHGVTGSGKSEVYLRAMLDLPPGRHAIVLVPEVSLTSHLIGHFREKLPFPLGVWHHQLSEGEKYDLWRALRRGDLKVLIGARSAVFAPMPDVGLIIVDEEHDGSYKQEDAPAYHAREVAMQRASLTGCTVVLGSATPSLESYSRAEKGEYTLLSLPSRYGGCPLPAVETVDLKEEMPPPPAGRERGKGRERPLLAPQLFAAAEETLESGRQVLFFLNRRGYAPFTLCRDCGWAFKCPNCQVSLVFHTQGRTLLCHYCGFTARPPELCPSCRGIDLKLSGTGTQRLEEEILRLFPGRRTARLDRDAVTRKGSGGRIVRDFVDGKTEILIGTQMAAKGFHFPRLGLVGVLAPDTSLNLPDFRAAERTFQLVTQVAGRAGREDVPGRVVIQTYQPEHYAIEAASEHDFASFYRQEMEFRQELDYPPFCDLVLLKTDGADLQSLEEATDLLADELRSLLAEETLSGRCGIFGPVPAPLRMIRGRYRFQILIKAHPLEAATEPLRDRLGGLASLMQRRRAKLTVDINPQNLL